jgi:N-6 DNA methylase
MQEKLIANPLLGEDSEDSPGRVRSLVLRKLSRERYAPLIEKISLGSEVAQRILARLSRSLTDSPEPSPWFSLWQEHCVQFFDLKAAESILAGEIESPPGSRLFLAHSYCRIVLTELISLALGRPGTGSAAASLYDWVDCIKSAELKVLRRDLRRRIAATEDIARLGPIECSDLLATIYQEIFPPALRHLLGEYYTPSWLVEYCIHQVQRHCPRIADTLTVLDPAAGSGSFLAHYIAQLGATKYPTPANIVGFDVNPLAVDFCRANTLLAASKARENGRGPSFNIQVRLADAVVDPIPDTASPSCAAGTCQKRILGITFQRGDISDAELDKAVRPFRLPTTLRKPFLRTLRQYASDIFAATCKVDAHVVVGNPPWIGWDGLTRRYREGLAPQWASSTLVVSTGWRAKVAAGKTDFSSLFVYRAAERHAAANAVMAFVLPLSLFQSHLAGAGFRTFRTADGRRFALAELDDFSGVKVFPDAANRTSVGTFAVDKNQQFPIRYGTWSPARAADGDEQLTCVSAPGGPLVKSEAASPIVAFMRARAQPEMIAGKSDYRARGGVNTGGANTILWLDVLGQTRSLYKVRNIGKSLRGASPVVVADIEKDAVYPLLCGADMRRWKAVPSRSILLLYSSDRPKKALSPDNVQSRLPKAYEFVSRFRKQLESRKEYHRWGCSGPFYEVYRIGPYTFSPIKVAWQHTGYRKALNVSVVDDRSRRPSIPDQKVILIPFDDFDEAHYACAFLSSSITAALLDRYLGADASTHILDYVALLKFAPRNQEHRRLAALSILAHQAAAADADVAAFEKEIDAIVARLLCVS